jgi:hypothetical protein
MIFSTTDTARRTRVSVFFASLTHFRYSRWHEGLNAAHAFNALAFTRMAVLNSDGSFSAFFANIIPPQ